MNTCIVKHKIFRSTPGMGLITLLMLTIAAFATSSAWAGPSLTVNGVSAAGDIQMLSGNYRWLIEEDVMYDIVPGVTCQIAGSDPNCLSEKFHKSYLPAIAEGGSADPLPNLDNTKRYHVSVLADGYAMGGSSIDGGAGSVTVHVNSAPIPTAQIRVFVFNDNFPINGDPDTAAELGLAGWTLLLEDAGGRYGISGQQISTDAYGNPLGTEYDNAGNVTSLGDGSITTDANGIALIQNLVPAKYGIQVVPPNSEWIQTTTLEGTHIIDAWVKAKEPPYFTEFGPPGPHVFIGFVKQFNNIPTSGGVEITGTAKSIHNSRPPDFAFHVGAEVPGCWVGFNDLSVGRGQGLYAQPCNGDSTFSIPNVPDGSYQLAIWDENLDYIFASQAINIELGNCNGGTGCDLGDVAIFAWFGRIEQHVFNDTDEDGVWDTGEDAMFEQPTALRWRDGTIYQGFPTDLGGAAPYDEVFPFFSWIVAEVGFDRFKATGATIIVDDGGAIPVDPASSFDGVLNPQEQAGGGYSRTELGPVLTQGVQTFLGQTNIIQWGKTPYNPGENGGISGVVYYAVTRAEDDPALAAPEVWEPGIPRIQLALYEDNVPPGGDGVIDDINGVTGIQIADVDNYPFDNFPGTEDLDYNGNSVFDAGDAVQITTTDSWDDNLPTDCLRNGIPGECFDGLAVFNQVRPAVFDGGYAFTSYFPNGYDPVGTPIDLPAGIYIVATGEHKAYKTVREEDRNIDFGEAYTPNPNLLPPPCVGDLHTVSTEFSLFPLVDEDGNPVEPFMAGSDTPLCDRKKVLLANGQNKAADFYMFTLVPVAAKITGFILDDTANEFDPASPTFGEKYAPPYLPVSIRDWTGREYGRTYSDRWGTFNAVVPSTYTTNVASSSGMSPNMVTTCMNDPGPIPKPGGGFMTDPNYDPQYSQFCYNFQYMPGVTTYLDTPVLPIAAFAGPNQQLLECRDDDLTPVIGSVIGSMNGPYVSTTLGGQNGRPYVADGTQSITVTSVVDTTSNPRDFGFGASTGVIKIGDTPLTNVAWSDGAISATVPVGTRSGQLTITRSDSGASNVAGINVTVGGPVVQVSPGGSIQQAIDLANAGDLVLVPPGDYLELVIMHKPVRLQGSGALTTINAVKIPSEKLATWRQAILTLEGNGAFDLLPSQGVGSPILGAPILGTEEGPGIIVLGRSAISQPGGFGAHPSSIDGFSITGSDNSGGIVVNGYAEDLVVSNNRIFGNSGIYGGGVRVGNPDLVLNVEYQDGFNDNIRIHHNVITKNGGNVGAGGGVSLYHGTDNYEVTDNSICGNFTQSDGGGIGHYGLSDNGLIANNVIHHNQSFTQLGRPAGGGIFIGGAPDLLGGLTAGAGSVDIVSNVIQGNQAGAGDGGGIALTAVNGELQGTNTANWHKISILNNLIVNNQTGMSGGGISLRDTVLVDIINNTIVHNESTATAGDAFSVLGGNSNISNPQPAGIVSYAHSAQLNSEISANGGGQYGPFARPALFNNIIYRNRSFYFEIDRSVVPAVFGLKEATPYYNDLAVLGVANQYLDPQSCLLTDTYPAGNNNHSSSGLDPDQFFSMGYVNTGVGETITQVELTTTIGSQPAFDEGGNFIQVRYGPLSLVGDYHLDPTTTGAPLVVGQGDASVAPASDIDGELRTSGADILVDIGADEAPPSSPPVPTLPTITSPQAGSTFTGPTAMFTWNENSTNVAQWWVYAGVSARSKSYFDSGSLGTQTSTTISGLPTDGSTVHVTLWYRESGGAWKTVVETYTAETVSP